MTITIVISLFVSFSFINSAFAQEHTEFERKGFVFGIGLGGAASILKFQDASEQHTDLGIDLKIGYMINADLAILLTTNVAVYDYSGFGRDRKRDFGVLAPTVQYWFHEKFWLLGGIGIGGDNPVFWDIENPDEDPLESIYYSGLGFIASAGYEIFRSKKNFTIDLKARAMYRQVKIQKSNTSGYSFGLLLGGNLY